MCVCRKWDARPQCGSVRRDCEGVWPVWIVYLRAAIEMALIELAWRRAWWTCIAAIRAVTTRGGKGERAQGSGGAGLNDH